MDPRPAAKINFRRLQGLFPVAVTLHNLEEAIWLPGWVAGHTSDLPYSIGASEFRFAAVLLTVAAYVVTYLSARRGRESVWTYPLFGYAVAMLANVFVPHIPAALIFRTYVPGLGTAVMVNLPVMALLWMRALKEGYVSGRKAVAFAMGPSSIIARGLGARC